MITMPKKVRLSVTALLFVMIAFTSIAAPAIKNDSQSIQSFSRFLDKLDVCNKSQKTYTEIQKCMKKAGEKIPLFVIAEAELNEAITDMETKCFEKTATSDHQALANVCIKAAAIFRETLAILKQDQKSYKTSNKQ